MGIPTTKRAGNSPAEFTTERSLDVIQAEVHEGMGVLKEVFGARFQPIFVPPWNTVPEKPRKGGSHLSVYVCYPTGSPRVHRRSERHGSRPRPIHIDLCDWHARDGAFIGK